MTIFMFKGAFGKCGHLGASSANWKPQPKKMTLVAWHARATAVVVREFKMGDVQGAFKKLIVPDQSIATASKTGKWSLTPWIGIGWQESFVAPRTKNPSKQASR